MTKVKLVATGDITFGINALNGQINRNGISLTSSTTIGEMQGYIDFIGIPGSSGGSAVLWDNLVGGFTLDLPWPP